MDSLLVLLSMFPLCFTFFLLQCVKVPLSSVTDTAAQRHRCRNEGGHLYGLSAKILSDHTH